MPNDPWAEFQRAAPGQFSQGAHDDAWGEFALAPEKVTPTQMRNAFLPGYADRKKKRAQADADYRNRDAIVPKSVSQGLDAANDFTSQMIGKLGVNDEIAGGVGYLQQAGENAFRRLRGEPVTMSAANAAQADTDYERERQAKYATDHPVANAFANAGSVFLAGRPTAGGITNPFLAGSAVAAQNAPFALARQEGTLPQRLPGAAMESALAFGAGAGLTAASNAFGSAATRAAARPMSEARQLSNAGIDLTPGQMGGPFMRRVEDAATSLPLTGAGINAAKRRGIRSFDVSAINQAIAPIGETIAENGGRGAVQEASRRVSSAYNRALDGVQVVPDAQYAAEIQQVLQTPNLPAAVRQDLQDIIATSVSGRMGAGVDGQTWKRIDEEIGAMARAADNAAGTQPTQRYLSDALQRVQDAHSGLLARVSPEAAQGVDAADRAFANMTRIEAAGARAGTAGREALFSPADLNSSVATKGGRSGRRQYARGEALMQDLTDPAMAVLPQSVPDSGTPLRALVTGSGLYAASGVGGGIHGMLTALGLDAAGWALYSRPAQAAINAAYRAATPQAALRSLSNLQRLAAQDPALVPVYRRLVEQSFDLLRPVERPQSTRQPQPEATTP